MSSPDPMETTELRADREDPPMFEGDIAKFSPADLLIFLAHIKKEGLLTVTNGTEGLSVSFKDGFLVDAHCELADDRILRTLLFRRLIERNRFDYLFKVKRETGLPLRQILEDTGSLPVSEFDDVLDEGIKEVLFQLFLWESGQFHFAEIAVDSYAPNRAFDCQALALETTRQVDEYREAIRSIASLDRVPVRTAPSRSVKEISPPERYVLEQAAGKQSIRSLVAGAPFPTHAVVTAVGRALAEGWIEFPPAGKEPAPAGRTPTPAPAGLFHAYKRSLRKVFLAKEMKPKVAELINFCKDHFDYTLVLASRDSDLVRGMVFFREADGPLRQTDIRNVRVPLDDDPIFRWVYTSRLPFFGAAFPSPLLQRLGQGPNGGECAILPLGRIEDMDFLVYVTSSRTTEEPGPFHFLELMSWHIYPPRNDAPALEMPERSAELQTAPQSATPAAVEPASVREMRRVVGAINELPPMPHEVTRTLQLMSDPASKVADITEALSRDQALVARLIKVSNSALYGGGQKVSALNQAVTRLGTRIIRSIILAAYTRSLFPLDQTNIGRWGQSLWQHSVECGLASRKAAEAVRYGDPEEAFVGGVLHDIGKVVILLNLPEEYRLVRKKETSERKSSAAAETEVLGFDHARLGEMLLERWNMPDGLRACVRHHHRPQEAGQYEALARIVGCGDYLSHVLGSQPDKTKADASTDLDDVVRGLELSDDKMQKLQETVASEFEHSEAAV